MLTLDTDSLAPAITSSLISTGYTYMGGVKLTLPAYEVVTVDTAADHRGVVSAGDNLWWLLLLGAVACGAGAIYLARRRIRLGILMAIDAVLMLAICLLLVPLIGQVVDDQASDPAQQDLLLHAYSAISRTLVTQLVLMVLAGAIAVVLSLVSRNRGRAATLDPPA